MSGSQEASRPMVPADDLWEAARFFLRLQWPTTILSAGVAKRERGVCCGCAGLSSRDRAGGPRKLSSLRRGGTREMKSFALGSLLRRKLAHPLSRGMAIDDPNVTDIRRRIIRENKFLEGIYSEWYQTLADALPPGAGHVLELGSGAGFLGEKIPDLITSEVFARQGVRVVLDGGKLPFADASLRAVVMTDVFHHLPQPRCFLHEAARCVRTGGVVAMIEPWVSPFSRVIYRHLHHEPFDTRAREWEFASSGPLSGANGALPWIVFERDRKRFEREFPQWRLRLVQPMMPFRYLLSGGVSMRPLMPANAFPLWRNMENALPPRLMRRLAMFAHIVLERR